MMKTMKSTFFEDVAIRMCASMAVIGVSPSAANVRMGTLPIPGFFQSICFSITTYILYICVGLLC